MKFSKSVRYIAMILVMTVAVSFGLPLEQLSFAETVTQTAERAAVPQYAKPVVSTNLGNFAETLLTYVEEMKKSIELSDLSTFKTQVKELKEVLAGIRSSIKAELDANSKALDNLNASNAKKRHNQVASSIEESLNGFESVINQLDELAALIKGLNGKDLEDVKGKISEIEAILNPEQPEQPLGALPYRDTDMTPPEPATGEGITPAYGGRNFDAAAADALPATPVQADLDETAETAATQEIRDLADSLGTPVKMSEYVKNNIDFEPYYGSRKGAAGTLGQKSGNDYDQASLLISMLRYKGIPARYVKGTIEISAERAMGWTGAKTPSAAVKTLTSLGIPAVSIVSGGSITAVRLEHIWVEAYVPYGNYRGAGAISGRKIWVPMDPSYKQYSITDGLDVPGITGITNEQINDAFSLTGERTEDTITNIDITQMSNLTEQAKSSIQAYIEENDLENANAKQLVSGKTIIPQKLGLLPLTLPYKTLTVLSETDSLPVDCSETIGFSMRGSDPFNLNFTGPDDFSVIFKAVDLYGKRITLQYVPATQEDADIISHYGGLFKTPAYMIQLRPQILADGEVIAEGSTGVGFGYRQEFTIAMGHAGNPVEEIVNPVVVGGMYSICLDYGNIDVNELNAIAERIMEVKDTATEENIYTDEVMGEILNSVGKTYFGHLDALDMIYAGAMNVSAMRQVSEGMAGYMPKVRYMFYTPVEVTGGSFYIDVDHNVLGVTSLDDNRESELGYMMSTGVLASSMENVIYEEIFKAPSVSAIQVLTEASARGIPIYSLNSSNIGKLNEISASASVKNDILNAVNNGKIVIIPQKEITYYDWEGAGYIVMDPETGAAGYMISGGIAGGSVAIDIAVTLLGLVTLAWAIYDAITVVAALLAATNPLVFLLLFGVSVLAVYNVISTLDTIRMYYETGDYQYAYKLLTDLALNVAFFGVFKILEYFAPGFKALFDTVKRQMGGIADIAARYGDEVAAIAARYGDEVINIIKNYGDDAAYVIRDFGDEAVQLIRMYGDDAVHAISQYGDDALNAIRNYGNDALQIIKNYGDDAVDAIARYGDDAINAIKSYGDDAVNAIRNYGDDAVQIIKNYGDDGMSAITQYGDDAVNAIKNYGDDAVQAIKNHGQDALDAITTYGDDAVNAIKNYGSDALNAIKNYGQDALDAITMYGDDAVNAIKNYGGDALNAIKNYGDDAVQLIKTYGQDAVDQITKYGSDAIDVIKSYGPDAVNAVKNYGDDAFNAIRNYGDDALEVITRYGDDAVRTISKYGEDGLIALHAYGDDLVRNITSFGDDAVEMAIKYGDNGMAAMANGIEPSLISKLDGMGVDPADFNKFNILSRDAAQTAAEAVERAYARGSAKTWSEFFSANSSKFGSIDDASDSYIKLIDDQSPWPEGFTPLSNTLHEGDTFKMVLDNTQPVTSPGGFGTFDNIPNVDYARNQLAIKSNWKIDCGKVVEYRIKPGVSLDVLEGPVGPQIDLGVDAYLSGGGSQIQLLFPGGVDRMNFLEVVSVTPIY